MRALRRLLLAALLAGLVVGCQPPPSPTGSAHTPAKHVGEKIEKLKEAPEGPKFRP
jgi:hypothetical protein